VNSDKHKNEPTSFEKTVSDILKVKPPKKKRKKSKQATDLSKSKDKSK